jgi:hypothetical protein
MPRNREISGMLACKERRRGHESVRVAARALVSRRTLPDQGAHTAGYAVSPGTDANAVQSASNSVTQSTHGRVIHSDPCFASDAVGLSATTALIR